MKRIFDTISVLAASIFFLAVTSCTTNETIERETHVAAPDRVLLDRYYLCFFQGETARVDAMANGGWSFDAQYESSNPTVATVDHTGLVTAIAEGEAVITVSDGDGLLESAQCEVTVMYDYNLIRSINFSSSTCTVKAGSETTLKIVTTPTTVARNRIYWHSSDETVASVDQNGVLSAVDEGVCVISATAIDGGGSPAARCTVTVESGSGESGLAIDKCNSVDGWSTGNGSITLDTQNFRSGTGSLSITTTGHYLLFTKKFTTPINASAYASSGKLLVTLYVSDASKVPADASGQLEISSSGTCDKNELCWNFAELGLRTGWNDITLDLSSGHETGGPVDFSGINYIRMYYNNPGNNIPAGVILKLDRIRIIK